MCAQPVFEHALEVLERPGEARRIPRPAIIVHRPDENAGIE
jgi:hypothetical protein